MNPTVVNNSPTFLRFYSFVLLSTSNYILLSYVEILFNPNDILPFTFGGHYTYKLDYQSPIGIIEILSTEEAIYYIMFTDETN